MVSFGDFILVSPFPLSLVIIKLAVSLVNGFLKVIGVFTDTFAESHGHIYMIRLVCRPVEMLYVPALFADYAFNALCFLAEDKCRKLIAAHSSHNAVFTECFFKAQCKAFY